MLSCHAATLRRAIKAGVLPAARLGKGFRLSRADLEAFWKERGGGVLLGDATCDASGLREGSGKTDHGGKKV